MQSNLGLTAVLAALYATTANAAALTTCAQGASDVCYAIAVPSVSAASNTGNLYMQITAPTSYQWVALGTGNSMTGSNMFILYQSGNNNITLSSRQGQGERMPQFNAATASNLQLLPGSGVVNGKMVANIMCTNCKSWNGGTMSTTATNSPWIGAWKSGASLASTNPAATITIHDGETEFNVDLTKATVATDTNPFTGAAAGGNTTTGAGGTTAGGTGAGTGISVAARPSPAVIWAHGVGMALCFAVLYPLGSAIMPMLGKWWLHAGWQTLTWVAMWAFFGLGVSGAQARDMLFNNVHTTFGTVIVCLLAIQPALGQLHHMHFLKHGGRGIVSYVHLYWGRIWMFLGLINGGLGLELANSKVKFVIAYAVISVIFWGMYIGVKGLMTLRKKKVTNAVGGKNSPRRVGYLEQDNDEVPMTRYQGK